MKRILMMSGALVLAAGAAMADVTPVKDVKVETDIKALSDPAAQAFYEGMASDLEAQIIADLGTAYNPDNAAGARLSVDIDEAELASTWENLTDVGQSRLGAQVNVYSDTDNSDFNNYTLSVSYPDIAVYLPPNSDISALTVDDPAYYQAMIELFAHEVVERL
ncbi:hypothetical protein ERN12_14695 [Rhodobacteraceae bacterium]|nr:hypothetical protein ERN12_14695 [Paracoccaceae bacterium]